MKSYDLTLTTEHDDGTVVTDAIATDRAEQLVEFLRQVIAFVVGEDL